MNKLEALDKILSDVEKQKIKSFVLDDVMREAVRKVLLFGLEVAGKFEKGKAVDVERNFAFSTIAEFGDRIDNEKLGAAHRALWEGLRLLQTSFKDLTSLSEEKKQDKVEKKNPAV